MNFYYSPEEIKNCLCDLSDFETETIIGCEVEKALYNLKCICENEYNDESYRIFYRILEDVTRNYEYCGRMQKMLAD